MRNKEGNGDIYSWEAPLLWQILPKLIDNICYVLLASAQDQNSSILCKCEIIPTRIDKFWLKLISQCKTREKLEFDSIMIKGRVVMSTTNHAQLINQYASIPIILWTLNVCQSKGMGVYSLSYWFS